MKLIVDIEKKYGSFELRSKFTVDSERFALLGASGCGKTLTLKCIAGIERPDRGRITLGERVLYDSEKRVDVPAREREIGYLFQNYALFPNMTVKQNIYSVAKDRAYADELMKKFCIDGDAAKYPAELSGGQSQRTALARMLVTRPKVLLFDEPLSALDNYMRTRVEHEILDILDEFHGPSILVTHDRNEAYRMSDRIGVMEPGAIVEIQRRDDFFDHPVTVAAARLTGCKNISRLERSEDGSCYAADWGVKLELPERKNIEKGGFVGYRAHFFQHIPSDTEDGANIIRCRLCRVIEDTFSIVICFKSENIVSDEPDSLLTWIVNKNEWDEVKEEVLSGSFSLRINPDKLMILQ